MILEDFLSNWLRVYVAPKRAKSTLQGYRQALAHLSDAVKKTEIDQVDPMTLQEEINALSADYSRQAQILFVALNQAMKRAQKLGLIQSNPMQLCEKPGHETEEAEVLTPEEATAYIREAMGHRCGPLLILMLCLGLRRNEARALKKSSLTPEGVLLIRQQRKGNDLAPLKTKSSRREIPVPEGLRSFFEQAEGEYLVDCSENGLRRAHLAVLAACGIDRKITLHGLRHSCATMAINHGLPLPWIQWLLGHKHSSTTADFYLHRNLAALTSATGLIYHYFADPSNGVGARLEIV